MNYTLENEYLKVAVADHGAEVKSIIRKSDGKELMWQADSAYWGRTSPVLFPLVGNYFEKKSVYHGKTYEMGQHGFARDMEFLCVEETEDTLSFLLEDDASTHEKYPFSFQLQITYVLTEKKVQVQWQVKNTNDTKMYFSIGAHPAFNCDLNESSMLFEKDGKICEKLVANIIAGDGSGCLSKEQDVFSLQDGVLPLSDELFAKDALVIEDEQADRVSLLDKNGETVVTVTCPTPLFGVWSPVGKHAPFVCIEPWYGRCDRVGFSQNLEEREYGNTLSAKEEFLGGYEMLF